MLPLVDGDIGDPRTAADCGYLPYRDFWPIDVLVNKAGVFLFRSPSTEYTTKTSTLESPTTLAGFCTCPILRMSNCSAKSAASSTIFKTLADQPIAGVGAAR